MKLSILISAFLAVAAGSATGRDYPDCDLSRKVRIAFSSTDATDVLSVSINGKPCYEATLEISITSADGHRLYHYKAPFKQHVVDQWDDPNLPAVAEELAVGLTDDASLKRTSDLPPWLPESEYYEANYQVLQIGRAYYDELRAKDWPSYAHLTYYEGWRVIAFDRRRKRTVVVSEGGL